MTRLTTARIALGALAAALACANANAATINFDEFPATNNNAPITTAYSGVGVTFSGTNAGTWGGLTNGDPGNWDLDGTNGPQFLGFNGPYGETITFSSAINSFSADFSRSAGSDDGTITLSAYSGGSLVTSVSTALGAINSWSTLLLSGAGIDSIELSGTGSGYHPFGMDNMVFAGGAVPEPASWAMMIAGFGLVGAAQRRRRAVAARFG